MSVNVSDKILIVEDEQDIADLIKVTLSELAIETDHASDGQQALDLALANDYQLVLLDVMLPGLSGLDVCRQLRDKKPDQAIVMLTSRNSETDRVVGLELGADDYLNKPFNVRELQARIRSHLRKVHLIAELKQQALNELAEAELASESDLAPSNNETVASVVVGDLSINLKKHQAMLAQQELDLTSTEFELLHFFAAHPEQVFSRSQLLDTVWGYHHSGYEHTVNSHINRLRAKLESDVANPQIIQTVWGVGYKFNPAGVF